jgi:hypothetical protein
MPHDVFISYSSRDKTTADATCAALEAAGIRCWIAPRDIIPGTEWGAAIIDAIGQTRAFVLIFSADANDSAQIGREVERAVHKGIPIIPLRIEDIAPTRSLEYFIGTVHWLDALTPPIEAHLRRLVDSLKAILRIEPRSTEFAATETARPTPANKSRRPLVGAALACLMLILAAAALWAVIMPRSQLALPATTPNPLPGESTRSDVDPNVVGTLVLDRIVDDYDWRIIYVIAADGSYRLMTTQTEDGTYQAGNGAYRTVGNKTGHVRTGTYRAVGNAIEVTPSGGAAAIFRAAAPNPTVDQAHPVMLGVWQSQIKIGGVEWTLTIQNNPDGSFRYQGRADDAGMCMFAKEQWWTKSAVTGQSNTGTYRRVDAHTIEINGPNGVSLWSRQ